MTPPSVTDIMNMSLISSHCFKALAESTALNHLFRQYFCECFFPTLHVSFQYKNLNGKTSWLFSALVSQLYWRVWEKKLSMHNQTPSLSFGKRANILCFSQALCEGPSLLQCYLILCRCVSLFLGFSSGEPTCLTLRSHVFQNQPYK